MFAPLGIVTLDRANYSIVVDLDPNPATAPLVADQPSLDQCLQRIVVDRLVFRVANDLVAQAAVGDQLPFEPVADSSLVRQATAGYLFKPAGIVPGQLQVFATSSSDPVPFPSQHALRSEFQTVS